MGLCTVAGEPVFNQRIRVDEWIESGAFEKHGIAETDLRDCPTWDEVWPLLGLTVLAYNSGFDEGALERSVRHLFPAERFAPTVDERG